MSLERLYKKTITPFGAQRSAEQDIDFALDPSFGLTRKRYGWWSNNSRFDKTLFSTVAGGIEMKTSATGTDTARIHSAFAGQYVSQTLAVPGQGVHLGSGVVSIDSSGRASLSHGIVAIGAGWHNGSSGGWNVGTTIDTFLGFVFKSDGVYAVCVSDGSHQANSPVKQPSWNIDRLDGTDNSNKVLDPAFGYIYNQPYTWYNEGSLSVGIVHPTTNSFLEAHRFEVDNAPSLDTPNLPTLIVADNDGTATALPVTVGGMQYSRYGGKSGFERRQTPVSRHTNGGAYISTSKTLNNNAVDPRATPGDPLVAIQRTSGNEDLSVVIDQLEAVPDNDIYIFSWDEWDYSSGTGANVNFRTPHVASSTDETKIEVDSEATSYTPQTANFRGVERIDGGSGQQSPNVRETDADTRVPIGATRVYSAVNAGTNADVEPLKARVLEGY